MTNREVDETASVTTAPTTAPVTIADLYLERSGDHSETVRQDGPFHVAALLDNVPEFGFLLGAAALSGAVLVGMNPTRRGAALTRGLANTDCQLLITEQRHLEQLDLDELDTPATVSS